MMTLAASITSSSSAHGSPRICISAPTVLAAAAAAVLVGLEGVGVAAAVAALAAAAAVVSVAVAAEAPEVSVAGSETAGAAGSAAGGVAGSGAGACEKVVAPGALGSVGVVMGAVPLALVAMLRVQCRRV